MDTQTNEIEILSDATGIEAVEDEHLEAFLRLRLFSEHKARLQKEANLAGITLSELIRRRYFGRKIVAKADTTMISELMRVAGLMKLVHMESNGAYASTTAMALRDIFSYISFLSEEPAKKIGNSELPRYTATASGGNYDAMLRLCLTTNEKEQLQEDSYLSGLTMSELVRRKYFGRHRIMAKTDADNISKLMRLGSSVKHAHNESGYAYSQKTASALHELIVHIESLAKTKQHIKELAAA